MPFTVLSCVSPVAIEPLSHTFPPFYTPVTGIYVPIRLYSESLIFSVMETTLS